MADYGVIYPLKEGKDYYVINNTSATDSYYIMRLEPHSKLKIGNRIIIVLTSSTKILALDDKYVRIDSLTIVPNIRINIMLGQANFRVDPAASDIRRYYKVFELIWDGSDFVMVSMPSCFSPDATLTDAYDIRSLSTDVDSNTADVAKLRPDGIVKTGAPTTPYVIPDRIGLILCSAITNAFVIKLPTPVIGERIRIAHIVASSGSITIQDHNGSIIVGSSSFPVLTQYIFENSGTTWYVSEDIGIDTDHA